MYMYSSKIILRMCVWDISFLFLFLFRLFLSVPPFFSLFLGFLCFVHNARARWECVRVPLLGMCSHAGLVPPFIYAFSLYLFLALPCCFSLSCFVSFLFFSFYFRSFVRSFVFFLFLVFLVFLILCVYFNLPITLALTWAHLDTQHFEKYRFHCSYVIIVIYMSVRVRFICWCFSSVGRKVAVVG